MLKNNDVEKTEAVKSEEADGSSSEEEVECPPAYFEQGLLDVDLFGQFSTTKLDNYVRVLRIDEYMWNRELSEHRNMARKRRWHTEVEERLGIGSGDGRTSLEILKRMTRKIVDIASGRMPIQAFPLYSKLEFMLLGLKTGVIPASNVLAYCYSSLKTASSNLNEDDDAHWLNEEQMDDLDIPDEEPSRELSFDELDVHIPHHELCRFLLRLHQSSFRLGDPLSEPLRTCFGASWAPNRNADEQARLVETVFQRLLLLYTRETISGRLSSFPVLLLMEELGPPDYRSFKFEQRATENPVKRDDFSVVVQNRLIYGNVLERFVSAVKREGTELWAENGSLFGCSEPLLTYLEERILNESSQGRVALRLWRTLRLRFVEAYERGLLRKYPVLADIKFLLEREPSVCPHSRPSSSSLSHTDVFDPRPKRSRQEESLAPILSLDDIDSEFMVSVRTGNRNAPALHVDESLLLPDTRQAEIVRFAQAFHLPSAYHLEYFIRQIWRSGEFIWKRTHKSYRNPKDSNGKTVDMKFRWFKDIEAVMRVGYGTGRLLRSIYYTLRRNFFRAWSDFCKGAPVKNFPFFEQCQFFLTSGDCNPSRETPPLEPFLYDADWEMDRIQRQRIGVWDEEYLLRHGSPPDEPLVLPNVITITSAQIESGGSPRSELATPVLPQKSEDSLFNISVKDES